jgi:hypothetical protein
MKRNEICEVRKIFRLAKFNLFLYDQPRCTREAEKFG